MKLSLLVVVPVQLISSIFTRIAGPHEIYWLVTTDPMPPGIFYMCVAGGLAVIVVMLCLNFTEERSNSLMVTLFYPFGQLALTHYVGHVVIGMGLLEAFGFLEGQTLLFSIGCALAYGLSAVIFSYYWRKRFRKGPLEMVMRKISG